MVCWMELLGLGTTLGLATRVWRWIPPAKGNSGENRSRVFSLAGASLSQLGLLLKGQ